MTALETPLILLGAGGHAKVLVSLAHAAGHKVIGVCDPQLANDQVVSWCGLPVLGNDDAIDCYRPAEVGLINGVGMVAAGNDLRKRLFLRYQERGYLFPVLTHPRAWVAPDAVLESGVQVMAGAIIQPGVRIAENTIINTAASIDHDCTVGAHVHVAPRATLCGSVLIGNSTFVGAGAVLIQNIQIGDRAIISAGVTLKRNLDSGLIVFGGRNHIQPVSI